MGRRRASSAWLVLGTAVAVGCGVPAWVLWFGLVWAWLLGINAATFALYGADKLAARFGLARCPERLLLTFAWIGGSPGNRLRSRATLLGMDAPMRAAVWRMSWVRSTGSMTNWPRPE